MPVLYFLTDIDCVADVVVTSMVRLTFTYPLPSSLDALRVTWKSAALSRASCSVDGVVCACLSYEFDTPSRQLRSLRRACVGTCTPRDRVTSCLANLLASLHCGSRAITDFITLYAPALTVGPSAMSFCHISILPVTVVESVFGSVEVRPPMTISRYHFVFFECPGFGCVSKEEVPLPPTAGTRAVELSGVVL